MTDCTELDITDLIVRLEEIADKTLYMCTQNRCTCAEEANCLCDSDEYYPIEAKVEIGSNCTAIIYLTLQESGSHLFKERKDYKIFELNGQVETVSLMIHQDFKKRKLSDSKLTIDTFDFKLDEPRCDKYGNFHARFNYMEYEYELGDYDRESLLV